MKWMQMALGLLMLAPAAASRAQFVMIEDGTREHVSEVATRSRHGELRVRPAPQMADARGASAELGMPSPHTVVVRRGQSLPEGQTGTFIPGASFNPGTLDAQGRIAFFAQVEGSPRNQGIFYADGAQLKVIAMGCGDGGGSGSTAACGDPTPIGGTFSGMFLGTSLAPTTSDRGDVLFIADVVGGSAPRALFLYRADTQDIIKVAAVGDPSPLGGTLNAIGPGSMNNHRDIAFLAITGSASPASDVLLWEDGQLSAYVAAGDPAPDGDTFLYLGNEAGGYFDGTLIPDSPVPGIDDQKQIAFAAITQSSRGYFISRDGVHEWMARRGDAAPGGGVFSDLRGHPVMNGRSEIAFFAWISKSLDVPPQSGAWFTGAPERYRRAFGHGDALLDGTVRGLAISRNPFKPFDDEGNLVLKATRELADESYRETLLVSRPDGSVEIVLGGEEAAGSSGAEIYINGWPSRNNASQVQFGAQFSAHPETTDGQFLAEVPGLRVFVDGFENL